MKRRKFVISSSIGFLTLQLLNTTPSKARFNRLTIVPLDGVSRKHIEDRNIYLKVDDFILDMKNIINTDEPADLVIKTKIEGQDSYNIMKSKQINLTENGEKSYNLENIKVIGDESTINTSEIVEDGTIIIDFKLELNHTDIKNQSIHKRVKISITSGELDYVSGFSGNYKVDFTKDTKINSLSGEEMSVLSKSDPEILKILVNGSGFNNNTSYTIKGGIDSNTESFSISPRDEFGEKILLYNSKINSLDGNEMDIFNKSRIEILKALVNGSGFNNNTSYTIKGGIDSNTESFSISPRDESGERTLVKPSFS
jgi:hypothetical protein